MFDLEKIVSTYFEFSKFDLNMFCSDKLNPRHVRLVNSWLSAHHQTIQFKRQIQAQTSN